MTETLTMFARLVAQVAVADLWQGSLIAGAIWICLRCLPRVSAAQRSMVWAAGFALVLVSPFLVLIQGPSGTPSTFLQVRLEWGIALAALWFVMFVVRGSGLLLQSWRLRQIWLKAQLLAAPKSIDDLLAECPRKAGLFTSSDVVAPCVIGFFSPRLLIPVSLQAQLSEGDLRQIVLHECEHLRRRDDWLNLLQKIALTIFPLHVALLWMDGRLGLERELACDAGVIAATGSPVGYAACLTRLAEHRMGRGRFALVLSAWTRRSELTRRVGTLLSPGPVFSRRDSLGSLFALACVLAFVVHEIAHAPHFISFAQPGAVAVAAPALLVPPSGSSGFVPVLFRERGNGVNRASMPGAAPVAPRSMIPLRAVRKHGSQGLPQHRFMTVTHSLRARTGLVEVRFSHSFAAVPFGDGWLIVQL